MADVRDIEDLKHTFSSKAEMGDNLPNAKDVADKASFYLKSGGNYTKHRMINGAWYKEKIDTDTKEVILTKV